MDDKRRKYGVAASVPCELLDRFPTHISRIEEELVYKLTDPVIKEAIKGECIVRFTETGQRENFTTGLIEFHKSVCVEEVVRCKDCKWRDDYGCALRIVDESDKPKDNDFCSFGERITAESE